MSSILDEATLSVAESAALVRVSESTVWRWIERGDLPAYRVGRRRVRVKRADLEDRLIAAREPKEAQGAPARSEQFGFSPYLTTEERERWLAALEEAKRFQERLLARRGGVLFSSGADLINEARDARSLEAG